jgi:hypothetical protein
MKFDGSKRTKESNSWKLMGILRWYDLLVFPVDMIYLLTQRHTTPWYFVIFGSTMNSTAIYIQIVVYFPGYDHAREI